MVKKIAMCVYMCTYTHIHIYIYSKHGDDGNGQLGVREERCHLIWQGKCQETLFIVNRIGKDV